MSKIQLLLTSLVAVIPGAFLIYLLVMAMLFSEALPVIAYVVMGVTLMAAAATVLIPAGILVGGNRKPRAPKAAKKGKDAKSVEAGPASEEVALIDAEDVVEDDDIALESSEFVVEDMDEVEGEDLLDEDDVETEKVDEFESFEIEEENELTGENDFDEIDFDDEPKPKKKR